MGTQPKVLEGLYQTPLLDERGLISRPWLRFFHDLDVKTRQSIDLGGVVTPKAADFSRAYTNKVLDNIPDSVNFQKTTPSQVTGAGRAFSALDVNARLVDALRDVPVNGFYTIASGLGLTQSGVSTTILVASGQVQFGSSLVNYNSGSVDPGALGQFFIYFDDPAYAGGTVVFQATQNVATLTAAKGRIYLGSITTAGGGGGSGGGSGSGGGGRNKNYQ